MAAALLANTTGFVRTTAERQQRRLGAAELANRLMLMYLDDPTAMPSPSAPIEYGQYRYRWSTSEGSVLIEPADPTADQIDRVRAVSFTVWLGEDSGGTVALEPDSLSVTLTRLVDPLAIGRNLDSADALANNDDRLAELLGNAGLTGSGSPAGRGDGAPGSGLVPPQRNRPGGGGGGGFGGGPQR